MYLFDNAWWMPDGERQLTEAMTASNHRVAGRLTFQHHKYAAARSLCPQWRVAVDVGSHVGLWSYWMAQDFAELHAFEPNVEARACWVRNLKDVSPRAHLTLHRHALGAVNGSVTLITPDGLSGGTYVAPHPFQDRAVDAHQRTLDSHYLPVVDLVKIDCEGSEAAVLEGARATIARCRPVIVVEQGTTNHQAEYGFAPEAAVALLESYGATLRTRLGSDWIFWFPEGS